MALFNSLAGTQNSRCRFRWVSRDAEFSNVAKSGDNDWLLRVNVALYGKSEIVDFPLFH